jgi:hypothetical protein
MYVAINSNTGASCGGAAVTDFVYHDNAEFARAPGAAEENFCNFFAGAFARPALRVDFFGRVFVSDFGSFLFFNLGAGVAIYRAGPGQKNGGH